MNGWCEMRSRKSPVSRRARRARRRESTAVWRQLGRPRHRSLPRGIAGGANGEVSWLRAFVARLPGMVPSGTVSGDQTLARYSGGAAPALHRSSERPRSQANNDCHGEAMVDSRSRQGGSQTAGQLRQFTPQIGAAHAGDVPEARPRFASGRCVAAATGAQDLRRPRQRTADARSGTSPACAPRTTTRTFNTEHQPQDCRTVTAISTIAITPTIAGSNQPGAPLLPKCSTTGSPPTSRPCQRA